MTDVIHAAPSTPNAFPDEADSNINGSKKSTAIMEEGSGWLLLP